MPALLFIVFFSLFSSSAMADRKPTSVDAIIATQTAVKGIEYEEAMDHYRKRDAMFLDIRTPAEWLDLGVIPGSVLGDGNLIPLYANTDAKNKMLHPAFKDTDQLIIVYCKGWFRGFSFAKMLHDMGYTNVVYMKKGFGAWTRKGGPITQPNSFNTIISNVALRGHPETTSLPSLGRAMNR